MLTIGIWPIITSIIFLHYTCMPLPSSWRYIYSYLCIDHYNLSNSYPAAAYTYTSRSDSFYCVSDKPNSDEQSQRETRVICITQLAYSFNQNYHHAYTIQAGGLALLAPCAACDSDIFHCITAYIYIMCMLCQQSCVKGQILQACRGHSVAESG